MTRANFFSMMLMVFVLLVGAGCVWKAQPIDEAKCMASAKQWVKEAEGYVDELQKNVDDEESIFLGRTMDVFESLNSLAIVQAKTGESESALKTFDLAMKLAPTAYNCCAWRNPYGAALCSIAEAQAEAGLYDLAENTIVMPQVSGVNEMSTVYSIVRAEAAAGEFERAKKFAASFQNNTSLFFQIAKAEAKAGKFEDAKKTSAEMRSLIEIALCEAASGDLAAAGKTLLRARDGLQSTPADNDCYYARIAEAQAKVGLEEAARETARMIQCLPNGYQPTFLMMADMVFKFHEKETALKLLEEAASKANSPQKLCNVAIVEAKYVSRKAALKTFERAWAEAEKRYNKDSGAVDFEAVVKSKGMAGFHSEARADALRMPHNQGLALRHLLRVEAAAGQYGQAKKTANKASEFGINDFWRENLYTEIAVFQARAGELAQAYKNWQSVTDPKPGFLVEIINLELDAGKREHVIKAVTKLEKCVQKRNSYRCYLYESIAGLLSRSGYEDLLKEKHGAIADRPANERFAFCLGAAEGYLKRIEDNEARTGK